MRRGGVKRVLDTSVLMLLLKGDVRVKKLVEEISQGVKVYTASTNLAELYYKVEEKLGRQSALTWFYRVARARELEVVSVDLELARIAGELKARYRGAISLADAIAAALAYREKARLTTTDRDLKVVKEVAVEVIK